ncbi:hypothetical protein QUB10_03610 [Microcoleus sp. B5-D4]|uniref:hypothetical protein n=1 Tax=unclassified Microcoleus TaxID=2642155 RepID=UPI002FD69DA5
MKLLVWSLSAVAFFFETGITKKAIALTGIKLVRSRYYESAIYLSDSARNFYAFSLIFLQNFTVSSVQISKNHVSLPDLSFLLNRRGHREHRGREKSKEGVRN